MREIETQDEFDDVLAESSDKLVIVDFHAAWCGPCKMIGPKVEKMVDEYSNAVFIKVDVDENEETAEK
jgi:thioredoxin 1